MIRAALAASILLASASIAHAGPPYVSDDPEPTPYRHFEIYTFNAGTNTQTGTDGQTGIDFNYGAAPNLQLTATLPAGFSFPGFGPAQFGLGNIALAAKYQFLHQSTFGWDVAVFPRVFLPSGSNVGDRQASFLLPVWVQRDLGGGWTTFGGGGCQFYAGGGSLNSCMAGWVLTRKVLPGLQIGAELSHRTASSVTPATTGLGIGAVYDLGKTVHLLGSVRTGLENRQETDRISWYAAILFTF